jgi:hypothetical protein
LSPKILGADQVTPGIPVIFRTALGNATGAEDIITAQGGTWLVIDAWVVQNPTVSCLASTWTLKEGATPISDAVTGVAALGSVVRAATLVTDRLVVSGETLTWDVAKDAGANADGEGYVMMVRTA